MNYFTYCIVIRYSSINLWVYERLEFILKFYNPKPDMLVLDLGSEWPYSYKLSRLCNKNNINYTFYSYTDVFSLSLGRNLCINHTKNKFIFFCDIDYIFNIDFATSLNKLISYRFSDTELNTVTSFPIIHLSKKETETFFNLSSKLDKDKFLYNTATIAPYLTFGDKIEFLTVYSNAILVSIDTFRVSGGYNLNFKGYGSEDFEYMISQSFIFNNIPLPKKFYFDKNPIKQFYLKKEYTGFRAYLEYIFFINFTNGIKCFHLYHEKPKALGYWTKFNDKNKINLFKTLKNYSNRLTLINRDFINKKNCLYMYSNDIELALVFFYRILGYKVTPYKLTNYQSIKKLILTIRENNFDSFVIPALNYLSISKSLFMDKEVILQYNINDNLYYIYSSNLNLDVFFLTKPIQFSKKSPLKKIVVQLDRESWSRDIKRIIPHVHDNIEFIFYIKSNKYCHTYKFHGFSIVITSCNDSLIKFSPDLIVVKNDISLIFLCKKEKISLSYYKTFFNLDRITYNSLSKICFSVDIIVDSLLNRTSELTNIDIMNKIPYAKKFFIDGIFKKPFIVQNIPFSTKSYISLILGISNINPIRGKIAKLIKKYKLLGI